MANVMAKNGSRGDARWESFSPIPIPGEQPPSSVVLPTRTQRARDLASTFTRAEPLSDTAKIAGVIYRFVADGRYTDAQITDALARLASAGRGVSLDTLRIELAPAKGSTSDARVAAGVALANTLAEREPRELES